MKAFPTIETERLSLDPIVANDREQVLALFSDPKVVEYYDLAPITDIKKVDELIAFFGQRYNDGVGIRWAIRDKDSKKLLGTCGFNSWVPAMRSAVLGYDLIQQYWGKGFVSEAVSAILHAGFDGQLSCGSLNRVQADTVPGNDASERLLRRLGFTHEGLRRQAGFWKAQYHDLNCYGLLKEDYARIDQH